MLDLLNKELFRIRNSASLLSAAVMKRNGRRIQRPDSSGCPLVDSFNESYLVDPASSHMLVSKIKPCMSKYKHLYTVKLRTAHYISYYLFDGTLLHGYP